MSFGMGMDPGFFRHRRLWPQHKKKSTVRTRFLIVTSPCVIISLMACAVPKSHIKKRSGPQNVWCKRNLVDLVLSSLFVRPMVNCYPCKQAKVMRSVSFFTMSGLNFLSCKLALNRSDTTCAVLPAQLNFEEI